MKKFPLTRRATVSTSLEIASPKKSATLLAAILMIAAARSEAAPNASTRAANVLETFAQTAPVAPDKKAASSKNVSKSATAPVAPQKTAAQVVAKPVAENSAPVAAKAAAQDVAVKKAVPNAAVTKAAHNAAATPEKGAPKTTVSAPTASKPASKSAVAAKSTAPNAVAKVAPAVKVAPAKKAAPRVLAKLAGAGETPQTVTFENGAQLVTRPDRAAPLVVMSLVVRAGAGDESAANAGWRRLLSEAMLRASLAKNLDEKLRALAKDGFVSGTQIQQRADELGGRIGASVGDDVIEFWASGPSDNAPQLADLLFAVALHPRLDESDLAAARDLLQVRGDDALDDPSSLATTALRTQLYRDAQGKATAYALPLYGTDASLTALSRESLQSLHARFFVPSRMVLSAAGDVNAALLKERLAALPAQVAAPMAAPFLAAMKQEPPLIVKQVPASLAWVFISYRVAGAASDDLPALRVLAAALGEARGARLPNRLLGGEKTSAAAPAKVRPATAAQVSVSFTPRRYGTEFIALAQVETARVESVKNAMLDEIGKVRNAPLSAQELTRARNYVLGSFATDREGLHERAYLAALATSYATPGNAASTRTGSADLSFLSRVAAVKSADVQRVARKYLTSYAVALLMPSP